MPNYPASLGQIQRSVSPGKPKCSFAIQGRDKYEGDWKEDKRWGIGKQTWPCGARYEGPFEEDTRNGVGTYWDEESSKILCYKGFYILYI